ncbi:MAG: NCS2 family permease [Lachnospiraceae bacterium]|nr:NCS2 family permease [Lachnospiraceae bacterium]
MDKFWKIKERGSTPRVEILAGITIFFATVYTVIVNPNNISGGITINPELWNGVFFASCIAAAIGTLLMAFYAKLPFAQAPGMGLSAVFAFTAMPAIAVLTSMGDSTADAIKTYQMTLPIVLISGVLFLLISLVGLREKIINGIPKNIKLALGAGIGLFITLLGLKNAGISVPQQATLLTLVNFGARDQATLGALLAILGVLIIAVLQAHKVKGSILIGIITTTILTYVTGFKTLDSFSYNLGQQAHDFAATSLFRLDFVSLFTAGNLGPILGKMLALILAFFLVNMFDSMGTIYGVASSAGMVDKKTGEVRGLKKGLMADAMATTAGGLAGTSTITTVVESSAGIGEGGRTGLTAFVTGILFIVAIFLAPFIALIPDVATAPALIFVGCLMMSGIKDVDFSNISEGLPAFLTIAMMPMTFSITNGIAFGLVSWVILKVCTGKYKEIKITTVVVSILFVLQYFLQ